MHNPQGILYGRSTGYHLSERGRAMADRVADRIGDRDITHIVCSPLERAQETAMPLAAVRGLTVELDERVIESGNIFEGKPFDLGDSILRQPHVWRALWNPFKPSWGEPYKDVVAPDVAGRDGRARGRRGARGRDRLPPAADLGDPAQGRGTALPARPPQAALHAVQPHLVLLRRRAAGQRRLLRARR